MTTFGISASTLACIHADGALSLHCLNGTRLAGFSVLDAKATRAQLAQLIEPDASILAIERPSDEGGFASGVWFGAVTSMFLALRCEVLTVMPSRWRDELRVRSASAVLDTARQLYGKRIDTMNEATAALLAAHGQRVARARSPSNRAATAA